MKTFHDVARSGLSLSTSLVLWLGVLSLTWPQLSSAQTKPGWQQQWSKVLSEAKKEGNNRGRC